MAIDLPEPQKKGVVPVEVALRQLPTEPAIHPVELNIAQVGQLLWACQGVSLKDSGWIYPFRTAPSAGGLYPLETFAALAGVAGVEPGAYRYNPYQHRLEPRAPGDVRPILAEQLREGEAAVLAAPLTVVLAGVFERTTVKYGDRGIRYVYMEVGHAAQNLLLQASALGLAGQVIKEFDGTGVRSALGMGSEIPLLAIAIGASGPSS